MKNLRYILLVALLSLLTFNLCRGQDIPYPIADEIKALPLEQYRLVIQMHNEAQYKRAADNARAGTMVTVEQEASTTVISGGNMYLGGYSGYSGYSGYFQTPTQVDTYNYNTSRTYELNRYGGGPVWIINPYTRVR